MANRTLKQLVNDIKINSKSFAGAGVCNQAHDDFITRLTNAGDEEKQEVLTYLKEELKLHGDSGYGQSGVSPRDLMSSMGLNQEQMEISE